MRQEWSPKEVQERTAARLTVEPKEQRSAFLLPCLRSALSEPSHLKLLLCILVVALSLVTLSLTACKDGDGVLVSGEFVGRVSNSEHLLVAVFVDDPDESGRRGGRGHVWGGFPNGI